MRSLGCIVEAWDLAARLPANWLPVRVEDIPPDRREAFHKRKRAVDLYLGSDLPVAEIERRTGVAYSMIYNIVRTAFKARADGNPVGYLACIPYYRHKAYERTSSSERGKAGCMSQLLAAHPRIREEFENQILGKTNIKLSPRRKNRYRMLYDAFREMCRAEGIGEHDYPFTNADHGVDAVRRYARQLLERDFISYARVTHGDGSARLAVAASRGTGRRRAIRPYERVQLDGHRVDGLLSVRLRDDKGDEVDLILLRVWLLVLIDEASRAVLGYAISLSHNYTAEDVLRCVAAAFEPWSPMDLPDRSIRYLPGAGLPSRTVDGCARRAFDTLKLDNAMAHLSGWVQSRVIEAGALEVVSNRPAAPRSNAIVERFFATFEDMTTHQWPSTVGSGPHDPRRRDPEAAAKAYRISLEDLERVASVAFANHNATPHSSLSGRSPLEFLRYRLSKGREIVRYAPERTLSGHGWHDRDFAVRIRAYAATGHWPFVNFKGVRYGGPALRERFDLKGQAATLRVDVTDVRSGWLFHEGACLGRVHAAAPWCERRHSLRVRVAIQSLIRKGQMSRILLDPVSDYLDYIGRRAKNSAADTNTFLRVRSEVGAEPSGDARPRPPTPRRSGPGVPEPVEIVSSFTLHG